MILNYAYNIGVLMCRDFSKMGENRLNYAGIFDDARLYSYIGLQRHVKQ